MSEEQDVDILLEDDGQGIAVMNISSGTSVISFGGKKGMKMTIQGTKGIRVRQKGKNTAQIKGKGTAIAGGTIEKDSDVAKLLAKKLSKAARK